MYNRTCSVYLEIKIDFPLLLPMNPFFKSMDSRLSDAVSHVFLWCLVMGLPFILFSTRKIVRNERWKEFEKQTFQSKSSCDILESVLHIMDLMFFGDRNTSHGLTLKLLADRQPSQQQNHPHLSQQLLFSLHFQIHFYPQLGLGPKLGNSCRPNFCRVLLTSFRWVSNITITRDVLIFSFSKSALANVPLKSKYISL